MRTLETLQVELAATEYGKTFMKAGFEVAHMGGGCLAWERYQFGLGLSLRITESEGVDVRLGDAHADNPDKPDAWLIGLYTSEHCEGFYMEAATAGDAIASCLALVFRFIVKRDLAAHLVDIDKRNAVYKATGMGALCATHDYCDTNMLMLEAWEKFCLQPMRPHVQANADLWNQAWQIAHSRPFGEA
ncbi:hypothetical protein ABDF71_21600 [Ochrobactrum sp. WV_118_8]